VEITKGYWAIMPPLMALAPGTKLGPYETLSPLGSGAWERCIGHGTRGWDGM
jgi:hypothetical protein